MHLCPVITEFIHVHASSNKAMHNFPVVVKKFHSGFLGACKWFLVCSWLTSCRSHNDAPYSSSGGFLWSVEIQFNTRSALPGVHRRVCIKTPTIKQIKKVKGKVLWNYMSDTCELFVQVGLLRQVFPRPGGKSILVFNLDRRIIRTPLRENWGLFEVLTTLKQNLRQM